jgi:hypothetical protein
MKICTFLWDFNFDQFLTTVKNDNQIGLIIYLISTDDWEYWLREEKKKSIVQKRLSWKMLANSFLNEFNLVSW